VATLLEASSGFGRPSGDGDGRAPRLGEHTDAWREEVAL
jgi:hypothetical protein